MFRLRNLRAASDDMDFVVKYWLDSYRVIGWLGNNVRARYYGKWHKQLIHQAIDDCQTIVVEDEKIDGLLVGFINYIPSKLVNYIHLKKDFRGKGLEEQLLLLASNGSKELIFTHDLVFPKTDIQMNYNPYPFLTGKLKEQ